MTQSLIIAGRRGFLAGGAVISASALALLAGNDALAAKQPGDAKADIGILNVAVGLEHEGIAAYEVALGSGLLNAQNAGLARKFQADHKVHNEMLFAAIRKLGGEPVKSKSIDEYVKELKIDQLKNETDVLDLAARLELGATNAYLGIVTAFKDPQFGKLVARLASEEATHFALLNFGLGRPLTSTMSFGA